MAEQVAVLDVAEAVAGGADAAKAAFEKGAVRVRVYALPRAQLRIRAKKRILRLDEGKLARLEKALILAAVKGKGGATFKEFADLVGDYKAAAAYLTFLWRSSLIGFEEPETGLNLYIASNALSQKTYEHRIARVLDKRFRLNVEKLRSLPSDEIVCVQRDGLVACRYIVANTSRSQAKAQVRALIEVAGYKPA